MPDEAKPLTVEEIGEERPLDFDDIDLQLLLPHVAVFAPTRWLATIDVRDREIARLTQLYEQEREARENTRCAMEKEADARSREIAVLQANSYPHMCRDGHVQIGHSDSEHEMCPLCRALATAERLKQDRTTAIHEAVRKCAGQADKLAANTTTVMAHRNGAHDVGVAIRRLCPAAFEGE